MEAILQRRQVQRQRLGQNEAQRLLDAADVARGGRQVNRVVQVGGQVDTADGEAAGIQPAANEAEVGLGRVQGKRGMERGPVDLRVPVVFCFGWVW